MKLSITIIAASRTKHITNYYHGMTTCLRLMSRSDREVVIQAYLERLFAEA